MAITMSGATINSSSRDDLLNSNVDSSILGGGGSQEQKVGAGMGGYSVNTTPSTLGSTTKLVGITTEFASLSSKAIDTYCENIEQILAKLDSANSTGAFKGSAIGSALANFIEGVKSSALNYLNKLKEAEKQIVESVAQAYNTQDTDISSNLASDTSKLNV